MHRLDKHSKPPHEHSSHDEEHNGAIEAWNEHVGGEVGIHLHLMEEAYTYACGSGTVGYTMKINEAGVAHHTMESVKGYKRHDIHHKTHSEPKNNLPKVLC